CAKGGWLRTQAPHSAAPPGSNSNGVPQQAQHGAPRNVMPRQHVAHSVPAAVTAAPQPRQRGGSSRSSSRVPRRRSAGGRARPSIDRDDSSARRRCQPRPDGHGPVARMDAACHTGAMASPPRDPMRVFDRRAVRLHRARAARAPDAADFLIKESAERLADRLDDVTRRFPLALDLGCRDGVLARLLNGRGGVLTLVQADAALAYVQRLPAGVPRLVAEAEALPFRRHSFDLVLSNLELHWANDLPGALLQLRHMLKPDGLLLAALLGGETLAELGRALIEAELAEEGGIGPRVSPSADIRDIGMLLQRAGFALPVVDSDTVAVTYPDALALMHDLRAMGETNAASERRRGFTRRATLARTAAIYGERFGAGDGRIRASFEIITLTAWAPHESQPQPLAPGSATQRLADALDAVERPAEGNPKRGADFHCNKPGKTPGRFR